MARRKCALPKLGPLENLGSLITFKDNGQDQCLGHLWHVKGHGTFDANFGKVDLSAEHADAHNKCLDAALLDGLDNQCGVGQGGIYYFDDDGPVTTWTGLIVAEHATRVSKTVYVFYRGDRKFRFIRRQNKVGNAVFVRRVK